MSPDQALSALDRTLAVHGQNATLRRYAGTGTNRTASDVAVRVRLDDYRPEELVGGIIQGDSRVILSPTQIIAGSWGGTPADGTDGRVPVKNDHLIVAGRARVVQAAVPFYMDGQLVRIELQVRG